MDARAVVGLAAGRAFCALAETRTPLKSGLQDVRL